MYIKYAVGSMLNMRYQVGLWYRSPRGGGGGCASALYHQKCGQSLHCPPSRCRLEARLLLLLLLLSLLSKRSIAPGQASVFLCGARTRLAKRLGMLRA